MRPNYKQIRLKDSIVTIDCCVDCPCYIYYDKCVWDVEIQPNYAIPNRCPLEEYILDEKIKNFLDDIENLTGGPSIKITPKQYNEVKE